MSTQDTSANTDAQLCETHTGIVILCGDRAYKVKKPITTDFLDFSTPHLRERACARELELNRRLAPDVYLGVGHLTDPVGGPAEPVLIMRRMPAKLRLSTLLTEFGSDTIDLAALTDTLVQFHQSAGRGPEIDRCGRPESVRSRWLPVLNTLRLQPPALVDSAALARVQTQAMRYLDGRAPLFNRRIAEGRIVDGHGDLLAQDIFALPDGFRILDCLDFDDKLRYVDCIDDIAFLAMDLEFLGYPDLRERLLTDYLHTTSDTAPRSLLDHYIAYRALVRAKVDVIRFAQGECAAGERARCHVAIAGAHSDRAAIRLALIGGLPGTGKSTVAQALSEGTGAVLLSSDVVRQEMAAAGELSGASGLYGQGRYSPASKGRVYAELLSRARSRLEAGESVVLDASWIDPEHRRHASALANATAAELVQIRCCCPVEVAERRIRNRSSSMMSEATVEIAAAMASDDVTWPQARTAPTDQLLEATVAKVLHEWHASAESDRRKRSCATALSRRARAGPDR
ncbi:AAA family ATPase [Nocardia cyriacigeorgica]|uniref:AAA family ATPase n=1 Tax=Nocardia cyriacigeorgica TaxID=135487 RepID=A0ABX0CEW1_9NOCA|nr:AAA family ATPase [Nocardia cyriacigeorgica]